MGEDKSTNVASNKTTTLDENQRAALEQLLGIAGKSVMGMGDDVLYDFPRFDTPTPGMNRAMEMSLAGLERMAEGGESGFAGLDSAQEILQNIMGRGPADWQEAFKRGVEDPTIKAFEKDYSPALKRAGIGSGGLFSSQTQDYMSRGWEDTMDAILDSRAEYTLGAENQMVQNWLKAAGLMPGITAGQTGGLEALGGAGEMARGVEMDQWKAQLAEFIRVNEERLKRLGFFGDLALSPTYTGGGVAGGPGLGAAAIGASGDWAQALAGVGAAYYENRNQNSGSNDPVYTTT